MKILISGSTGLVGSALVPALQSERTRGGAPRPLLQFRRGIHHLESHVRAIERCEP